MITSRNLTKCLSLNLPMNPNKNNNNLVSVHQLFAPMEYEKQIVIVKITVKEMKNLNDGNRIYTIKALDVFLDE